MAELGQGGTRTDRNDANALGATSSGHRPQSTTFKDAAIPIDLLPSILHSSFKSPPWTG